MESNGPRHFQAPDSEGLQINYDNAEKVVVHHQEPPEVARHGAPELAQQQAGLEPIIPPAEKEKAPFAEEPVAAAAAAKPRPWTRKRVFIPAVIIIIAVIVGAIVGGVVGSRSSSSSSDSDSSNSVATATGESRPTSSATSTLPVPTSIASGSAMAVSAHQVEDDQGGYAIYLYYQSPDGELLWSRCNTPGDEETSDWAVPQNPEPEGQPIDGSGIATSVVYMDVAVQYQLIFVNDSSRINGMNYNTASGSREGFRDDRIDNNNVGALSNTRIAAYGPFAVYQDLQGDIQGLRRDESGDWWTEMLGHGALDGTKLAIVPLTTNYTQLYQEADFAMFYQTPNGDVSVAEQPIERYDPDLRKRQTRAAWPQEFPDITIPDGNTFAAFSTARTSDEDEQLVSTYFLYQDENSDIQQLWVDGDGTEWQSSSPEALVGADENTDIACINMPTWDILGQVMTLAPAGDMSRCYFMRGGYVVEVRLSDGDWEDMGPVAIP